MIVITDFDQGTPEWHAARLGNPGASNFNKIITTTGKPSAQATDYMYQLAGEFVAGAAEDTYQSIAMITGLEREAEARSAYEFITGLDVEQVAICYHDEKRRFHCSPDGLVDGGGLEIKCPSIKVHTRYLIERKLPTDYFCQVHGSMYVTGAPWWDFFSYYPGLPPFMLRVERDENWIEKLSVEIEKFCNHLDDTISKLKEM